MTKGDRVGKARGDPPVRWGFLLLVVVGGPLMFLLLHRARANAWTQCASQYSKAHTASDSLAVDHRVVQTGGGRWAYSSCGNLRASH